jgi:hypothetical protein
VLNALTITVSLITTGRDDAMRSEMLDVCQRNVREMGELLTDLKDYSVLIAGDASLQIEEINVRVLAPWVLSSGFGLSFERLQDLLTGLIQRMEGVRPQKFAALMNHRESVTVFTSKDREYK